MFTFGATASGCWESSFFITVFSRELDFWKPAKPETLLALKACLLGQEMLLCSGDVSHGLVEARDLSQGTRDVFSDVFSELEQTSTDSSSGSSPTINFA